MKYRFDSEQHVHTLDGAPLIGTSSMASVLAKPLTWWASGLAVSNFGWINKGNPKDGWVNKDKRLAVSKKRREEISSLTDEEYLSLLDTAYAAHSSKLKTSAQDGTDLHELMEKYVKHCINKNGGAPMVVKTENAKLKLFYTWAIQNVKKFLWSEAHCFSKELWLGGISDCGYEDNDGKIVILDFKSSKDVYLSQFWQCIGYALQIEENGLFTPEGELVLVLDRKIDYVAVLPFGMENPTVQFNYDMKGGADAVRAMLLLYKKLN